jgi:FkbM family methyltransferase
MLTDEILSRIEITCVDAGAAGGLNELSSIRKSINLYSFEPLLNSFTELKSNSLADKFKKHEIFPYALHSHSATEKLHIARRPSMSSLLEFDNSSFDKHFGFKSGSAAWKQMLIPKESISVNVTTIDKWAGEHLIDSVDFLKIDTQGTELEILKGAEHLLDGHKIKVIKTEFSNFPVYKNQCLYPEIDAFLRSKGFELADCLYYNDTAYQTGKSSLNENRKLNEVPPIGAGGDAVYVLASEYLDGETALKAGIILGSLGYFGLASGILNKSKLSKNETEQLLMKIAPAKRFRKKLKEFIPPVLIKLYKTLRT